MCEKCEAKRMMNELTWRDVFDSTKIYPATYDICRNKAKDVGYKFIAFNGWVYSVNDLNMKMPQCTTESL